MNIEFIGHAGFCVRVDGLQILVDPWITPSTFERPVITSFSSFHSSIDYLIPEPVRQLDDFSPDIILLSHYHAHHSSLFDIQHWLEKSTKQIDIIGPSLFPPEEENFLKTFAKNYPRH